MPVEPHSGGGPLDFLAGGGEMGALIRATDWSRTPIGPIESWSPALRMMVRFLLANRFPLLLWWGPEYVSIYNDAYRPVLGAKHPWALAQPVSVCWSEIWHILQPLIDTPFHGGPATWNEDIFLEINRRGFVEETHFTIAYSPVPDETVASGIGGVLATVHEITEKVVGERRVVALRDLGAHIGEAKTAEDACAIAARTLAEHGKDVPFVLLYLLDEDGRQARLAGAAGVKPGDLSPAVVDLDETRQHGWPLAKAIESESIQVVDQLDARFSAVPPGPWSDPPSTAVVLPIPSTRPHMPAGVMVAGVSARLKLDEYYRDFFELVRTQIAAAIANARAYEDERKRAEALAEIDRAKTSFFSNVSHEFRTPLTLMLGSVEELLGRQPPDAAGDDRDLLAVVQRNGFRMLRLVNTLLDFSRIEAGRVQAVYEPTDLAAVTAELASNFRSACERAGLRLVVDCPALPEPVHVDRDMWEKIVLNLLSNAFKFTFDGTIEVTLRAAGRAAALVVRDTGIGIPAEETAHVFERFHRVPAARGRTHEGTGIGLALVQELVKLHGGSIEVSSVMGQGSAFTVTLPIGTSHLPADRLGAARTLVSTSLGSAPYVEEALRWLPGTETVAEAITDAALPSAMNAPAQGQARSRIVWADDNADMREYVRRLLSAHYDVEAVPDGRAALTSALARRPDLVLADIMMPVLDGVDLLRGLRADPRTRTVPVILLSARAGEEARVEGLAAGADDYLVKPFSARELLARVSAHLQIGRIREAAEREIQASAQALRSEREFLQSLIANAPIAVAVLEGPELRFSLVNPVYQSIVGSEASVLGQRYRDVFPDVAARGTEGGLQRVLRTGEPWRVREFERMIPGRTELTWWDGEVIRVSQSPGAILVLTWEVSERKLAEEALRAADRAKDEFLATLSHELRTPLTSILGWSRMLRVGGVPEASAPKAFEAIERNARLQAQLIEDLLDISRIISGKLVIDPRLSELSTIVRAAVDVVRPTAEEKRVVLSWTVEPIADAVVVDPDRFQQVIWNLLSNAIKFTPPDGRVTLEATRVDGSVRIAVADTGAGISPEFLPFVFERFRQGERSSTTVRSGLGLGLAIVRHIVELHGGTVRAASAGLGQGATFTITLPV